MSFYAALTQIKPPAPGQFYAAVMKERASMLRRRLELYRRYLRDGVEASLAQFYLAQIIADEGELARIEREIGERE